MEAAFATAERERERWGIPGLALGLLVDGSVELRGFGVEPGERFRIASITKPFVARLATRGLDLDAPLETPTGPATPRQLLSHQSGLACERSPTEEIVLPREDPRFVELPQAELAELAGRYGDELERATVSVSEGGIRLEVSYRDVLSGEDRSVPPIVARPVATGEFVVAEGEQEGEWFDFPEGFLRFGSMLAERAEN